MNKTIIWIAAVVSVLVAAAIGVYFWQDSQKALRARPPPVEVVEPAPAPKAEPKAEPAIRYPIEDVGRSDTAKPEPAAALPALADSDAAVQAAIASLVGAKGFAEVLQQQDLVHRIVATVDNLPREKAAQRLMPVKPIAGRFATAGSGEALAISPSNYARYAPLATLAETVDAKKLASLYARLYPLFQQEYRALGYPNQYFNDRLIAAIDDLLAAPDPAAPVKLVQPKVLYQFADPELEKLSAGQKTMIRMGSANANRIKAQLRIIRRELAGRDKNR